MVTNKRVLICANPDLNYIDGSSIWAQTIALATVATGLAKVDFLAKSPPAREELFAPLRQTANLQIIDGTSPQYWQSKSHRRLTLPMMAELAVKLDQDNDYDVIIVRGLEIAEALLPHAEVLAKCWLYLTDIPQSLKEYSSEQRSIMRLLAIGSNRLLCQTQGFQDLWQALAPELGRQKLSLYTPVIPDFNDTLPALSQRPVRAVYAGKFKGEWMTLDMAAAWPMIYGELTDSELLMIGDKIHVEPEPADYQQRMRHALEHTPGLRWLGALSREQVQEQLRQARVGLSWRSETMNDTVEYSTKILEYGGAGCAAILNRNSLHEQLLGSDYPLFANSHAEFVIQLKTALCDDGIAQNAANALQALAKRHTFSARVHEIRKWLTDTPQTAGAFIARPKKKTRVLVAGHDLKFFTSLQAKLEETGEFEFLVDQWQGHNKHDEARSFELLDQADVIFCEWCLGNLKWYSHHKRPHQRLVARFHAQEIRTTYLTESNWDSIDHISFVSEHTRRDALSIFSNFSLNKTSVIKNYINEKKFTTKKKTGDALYTLGILGVAPKSKRLDRAVDLLESLLEKDSRYCLRVKGKNPLDYGWLLNREDELTYYQAIFQRINSNPKLRHKVIFDPAGDDVNEWFTMVGFILSPSDFESFHMAIGEGMLTGAIPIIWNWDGSGEIWGAEWLVGSIEEATKAVLNSGDKQALMGKRLDDMSSEVVRNQWQEILTLLGHKALQL